MSVAVQSGRTELAFDVIVVAASLGGLAATSQVLAGLPADFPVPILLVQHRMPRIHDQLAALLQSRTGLPVQAAADGQLPHRGVTILPAGHSATIDATGRLHLREFDGGRPADFLLVSVAAYHGQRALCVVLTGRLDDAATGVREIRRRGGRTIVEDPTTARASGMPAAAVATGCVDLVMPLRCIPHTLIAFTMAPGAADLFRTVLSPGPPVA